MEPKNLQEDAKRVHLLAHEKSAIKARILEGAHETFAKPLVPIRSPFFSFTHLVRTSVATLALFIVAGTSLTYAAQGSAPGDTLYGLELGIIEPIEEAFQRTPEKQVAYHTDRLEERLTELKKARKVSREPASYVTFNERVAKHVDEVEEALADEIDAAKKVDALIEINALVRANEDLLEELESETDTFDESEREVRASLSEAADSYGTHEEEERVREDLLEDLRETTFATTTDAGTVTDWEEALEDIEAEIETGDIREAFKRTTEIRVEIRKQLLLQEEGD